MSDTTLNSASTAWLSEMAESGITPERDGRTGERDRGHRSRPLDQTPARGICSLGRLRQDWRRLPGYWVPAAQVGDGLAVLPLDGVLEQVGQVPAGGDAGDVGDPAAGPDRDDEALVVEGERLQRPAVQLRVQVAGR